MKKLLLVIFILFSVESMFSQDFTNLTKKQMYADFDQLVKIIEDGNPQLEVRKIVTGFHQLDTIKSLRKNIDTISNYYTFRNLLNLALTYCFDGHTNEIEDYTPYIPFVNLTGIDTASISMRKKMVNTPEYDQKRREYILQHYFSLDAFYYNDNYYILGDSYLINKDKTDTIHIYKMTIKKYNGQDFKKYIEQNCKGMFYYDYIRQKYICNDIYIQLPSKGVLEGIQYGKIIKFNIEDYPMAMLNSLIYDKTSEILLSEVPKRDMKKWRGFEKYEKRVNYFAQDSILYIYLDQMVIDTAFCNNIKETGKGKKINKVVIDVRGNGGGNDMAWWNVLSAIIKDTLQYRVKLACNNTKLIHKKFKGFYPLDYYEKIEWLDNKKLCIIDRVMPISPDTNSIKYDGKIYILSDKKIYSSTGVLIRLAEQFDNIISIGCPTGQIEGAATTPQIFQLKNSKFTFRMPCVIDILNCNKAIDVYHDFPEILVYPTFEEEMIYSRTLHDLKTEIYLRRFDSMFLKVLELE